MNNITDHTFHPQSTTFNVEKPVLLDDRIAVGNAFDEIVIAPLLSGKAYNVNIKEFKAFDSSSFAQRFEDFGLDRSIKNGHYSEYNIEYKPFLVHFEFQYNPDFLHNAKDLFEKISSTRYCDKSIRDAKDIRNLDIPCAIFGDFNLEYIEREGWFGIKNFYLETFQGIRLEYASLLANKLNKISSNLYFSFCDSDNNHLVGVYSDFRDYSLTFYNTEALRKVSKILVNTTRPTYVTYQVEPLSSMALSYRLRTFFLVREKPEENYYAFIIYLSEEEVNRISKVRAWAHADR
ncbi:hypothetical protein CQA53_06375 [Helicobacter didelphidarum]|uniref:Uncharacterized protein n=1 Tax=Helicobacter didelphidarum TaxID=2040648 RepID=A0A3D8IKI7_9HELI|nr:hypothetical protein [Helicobacter didelphidarum]RDU65396.1 hypothetical protein CQA53_06375 [Helicobacter didelphidarum]